MNDALFTDKVGNVMIDMLFTIVSTYYFNIFPKLCLCHVIKLNKQLWCFWFIVFQENSSYLKTIINKGNKQSHTRNTRTWNGRQTSEWIRHSDQFGEKVLWLYFEKWQISHLKYRIVGLMDVVNWILATWMLSYDGVNCWTVANDKN